MTPEAAKRNQRARAQQNVDHALRAWVMCQCKPCRQKVVKAVRTLIEITRRKK